jgi:hypothetical protein
MIKERKRGSIKFDPDIVNRVNTVEFLDALKYLEVSIQYSSVSTRIFDLNKILSVYVRQRHDVVGKPKTSKDKRKPSEDEIAQMRAKQNKFLKPMTETVAACLESIREVLSDFASRSSEYRWSIENKNLRYKLDTAIATLIMAQGDVDVCITCYLKIQDQARRSHIISNWYLDKVIGNGLLAIKETFVKNKSELAPTVCSTSMTVEMQCSTCEVFQSEFEGKLSFHSDALRSLHVNAMLEDEFICEVKDGSVIFLPSLLHCDLYGFLVVNMMRLLAIKMKDLDIASKAWKLFDSLRLTVNHLRSSVRQDNYVCIYCIPIGYKVYNAVCEEFLLRGLWCQDNAMIFELFDKNNDDNYLFDDCYLAVLGGPLVWIASCTPLEYLNYYRVEVTDDHVAFEMNKLSELIGNWNLAILKILCHLHLRILKDSRTSICDLHRRIIEKDSDESSEFRELQRDKHLF